MIQNKDIGFVREGQDAEIKIEPSISPDTGCCTARW